MEDGEVELSDHVLLADVNSSDTFQALPMPVDSPFDDLLKNNPTCTHTHTCNPPGPKFAHTHTCHHTHTQVLPKPERPSGNREAVRKYREKKKAETAYLEEEVKKLRLVNQELIRKLQGQASLEADAARLRGLLLDLKVKIDKELGVSLSNKQYCNGSTDMFKDHNCENGVPCFHPNMNILVENSSSAGMGKMVVYTEGNCQPATVDCGANTG